MARRISRTSKRGREFAWPYEVTIALPWRQLTKFMADEGLPGYWDAKADHSFAPWQRKQAWASTGPKQIFLTDSKTAVLLKLRFG